MGSPSSRLNVPEKYRPWLESGLEYVFNPTGYPAVEQPQASQQVPGSEQAVPPHSAPPQFQSQQPISQSVSLQSAPQQAAPQQSAPQQSAPQQAAPQQAAPERPVPSSPFPAPWDKFLASAPPTPKVVWTYMELGLDLDGQADPRRGGVLRNLINHLKWPKGTTAFWPVAALSNGALQPDRAMFWRGWELWKTPYVVCFGDEALRVMLPGAQSGVATHLLENVTVHVLPPLSKLMTMLPHEQQLAVDALTGLRL